MVPSSSPPADVLVSERRGLRLLRVVPAPLLLSSQVSCGAVSLLDATMQPSSDVGEDFSFSFFCSLGGEFSADLLSVSSAGGL